MGGVCIKVAIRVKSLCSEACLLAGVEGYSRVRPGQNCQLVRQYVPVWRQACFKLLIDVYRVLSNGWKLCDV